MGFAEAYRYLEDCGMAERVKQFDESSATVELAASALGTAPAKIAKSLTFMGNSGPVMIITAGDAKVKNGKFKAYFGLKAKMLSRDQVNELIGHDVGGVCPFGIKEGVNVYLDSSLKRFEYVYPACGDAASGVELTPDELYELSGCVEWIDVCDIVEV